MPSPLHSEFARELRRNGWQVTMTSKNHLRAEHPDAAHPVILAGTPSDYRNAKNARAQLRRALNGKMR